MKRALFSSRREVGDDTLSASRQIESSLRMLVHSPYHEGFFVVQQMLPGFLIINQGIVAIDVIGIGPLDVIFKPST